MSDIFRIVIALFSNGISAVIAIAILVYFLLAVYWVKSKEKKHHTDKHRTFVQNAPGAMTSLGILGTFLGIAIGLLNFDIRLISKSVPELLEGLKVAFGTSILGLFFALLFRIIKPLIQYQQTHEEDDGSKIIEELSSIREINEQGFEEIKNALTDDGDSSVAGQLQRLRTNIADLKEANIQGFTEQIKEFKNFAEHMSKAFSEAIIEELKSVIREFNDKISEQFGENFKQLNEAVGRLVEWQENYRIQLAELKDAFDKSVKTIDNAAVSIQDMETSFGKIFEHTVQFQQVSNRLEEQINDLESRLEAFAEMREKATDAFPLIEKNIQQLTEGIKDSVTAQASSMQSLQQMQTNIETTFNQTVTDSTQIMNDSINKFDQAIQSQVEKIMNTMVQNLSGITEQFVKDYTPILETTRKFVEFHRRAES